MLVLCKKNKHKQIDGINIHANEYVDKYSYEEYSLQTK